MRRSFKNMMNITALLVAAAFILTACPAGVRGGRSMVLGEAEIPPSDYSAPRFAARDSFRAVYENESCILYFDCLTGAAAVESDFGGKRWATLPEKDGTASAANIRVRVVSGNSQYVLDSQLHAGRKPFSFEKTRNGIRVSYEMCAENVSVKVPVTYSLSGASLEVGVRTRECVLSEGAVLLSLSLLPFMGAQGMAAGNADDYFLVPDGCGAVMRLSAEENAGRRLCFSVYGKNVYEDSIPATAAAYGIRSSDSALAVCAVKGEETAVIRANGGNIASGAVIYPEFIITPVSGRRGEIFCGTSYSGDISVLYTPLYGTQADYVGIANCVRENFVRNGFLSEAVAEGQYPLNISLAGFDGADSKTAATTLEQAQSLLKILRGKGVNSVNLILEGFLSGGMRPKDASSARISSKLGGKKQFSELCDYAEKQKINVFLGVNLFSSAAASPALGLKGESVSLQNGAFPYRCEQGKKFALNAGRAEALPRETASFLKYCEFEPRAGLCVLDAAKEAYADYSSKNGAITAVCAQMKKNLTACGTRRKLMLSGCNLNVTENAAYLKDVPMHTFSAPCNGYEAVPFIPAVLRSSCVYSGSAINLYDLPQIEQLRNIEYGAVPCYSWSFSEKSDRYYEEQLVGTVAFYLDARKNLSDLCGMDITAHFQLSPGVYCTEYGGSARVYVNYNNVSAVIGEISVMPYGYLRVG